MAKPLAILLFALLASSASAAITAYQGEAYVWQFHLTTGGTEFAVVQYDAANKLDVGESASLEFYEDSLAEAPLMVATTTGPANGWIHVGFAGNGFFQDLDGIFVVRILSGSAAIKSLYVSTKIDGVNYFASEHPAIPEPSPFLLAVVAALGCWVGPRRVWRGRCAAQF